ncbi:2-oxo-4-hydroxy-4-carboxy-5-ureidoimidazoline decarboxylase [Vacuolonema iberomarrocanum]|uniref:2-oxo-4-hydroxy-4-carboxy-5-ureidoimidazoline decarboxylase n=1 Tax=Vacuolonema iberomarrocanum TaxID=3454632 RepID=UPI003F6E17EE
MTPAPSAPKYTLAAINQMNQSQFVAAFGELFEQTPAIARQVWHLRPFTSAHTLYEQIMHVVRVLSTDDQLALIRAHPDLGSKTQMADASVQEQAGVGLDRLTAAEYERFHQLNSAYKETFGFPFIIAVRHHTKASILQAFEERLQHDAATERDRALAEILEIVRLRLRDRLVDAP